ncbi:MAG: hypothetical protein ABIZ80_15495, partial [Bryobacteraceae bacterium]
MKTMIGYHTFGRSAPKVLSVLIFIALFGTLRPAVAQELSSVRFTSVPPGRKIVIDGQNYSTTVAFNWPRGSCHSLSVLTPQYDVHDDAQFTLGGIVTNLGSPVQNPICADPQLTEVLVNFSVAYKVYVSYYDCQGYSDAGGRPCPASLSPGTVYVGGTKFTMSGVIYLPAGTVTLQAFPNLEPLDNGLQKWVFDGWYVPPATIPAFLSSFRVTGPLAVTLTPRFIQARRVDILSSPAGLQLVADRTLVTTPHAVAWGWNTTHTLGVVRDQNDKTGKLWIF